MLLCLLFTVMADRLPLPTFVQSTPTTVPTFDDVEESYPKTAVSSVPMSMEEFQQMLTSLLRVDVDGINSIRNNKHQEELKKGDRNQQPNTGDAGKSVTGLVIDSTGVVPVPKTKTESQTATSLDQIHPIMALLIGLALLTTCLLTGKYRGLLLVVQNFFWLYCRL
jgi:hypothetical protein